MHWSWALISADWQPRCWSAIQEPLPAPASRPAAPGAGSEPAAAVLVASANPIDQFLAHHPDYFFGRSPEQALINPDHLLILLNHLRCAMFELPFARERILAVTRWMNISSSWSQTKSRTCRTNAITGWLILTQPQIFPCVPPRRKLCPAIDRWNMAPVPVGIVDGESALWMVHPGAVYLHEARQYFVENLDLEKKTAHLRPFESDYFTEPLRQTSIKVLSVSQQEVLIDRKSSQLTHSKGWGELQVTTQVVGFRKLRWYSRENLGEEALDLPPTELQTTGYWLSIAEETVNRLSQDGLWTNAPNDYGPGWMQLRDTIRQRDGFRCQVCGRLEKSRQHDVHHKIPFRLFRDDAGRIVREKANDPGNLTTLCPECHKKVEMNVRMRSGLAGLAYVLGNLAPLFLMCDPGDLGTHIEPVQSETFPQPSVVLL